MRHECGVVHMCGWMAGEAGRGKDTGEDTCLSALIHRCQGKRNTYMHSPVTSPRLQEASRLTNTYTHLLTHRPSVHDPSAHSSWRPTSITGTGSSGPMSEATSRTQKEAAGGT